MMAFRTASGVDSQGSSTHADDQPDIRITRGIEQAGPSRAAYSKRVACFPMITARLRFPVERSVSISRRLLTAKMAVMRAPTEMAAATMWALYRNELDRHASLIKVAILFRDVKWEDVQYREKCQTKCPNVICWFDLVRL